MEKKELRKIIRKRKNEHTDEELKALSEPIMELSSKAKTVANYTDVLFAA